MIFLISGKVLKVCFDGSVVSDVAQNPWGGTSGSIGTSPSALLREDAPHFRGRSSSEVELLRAYLMAQLAENGAAEATLPYAIEELRTGQSAHALAAAARVISQIASPPIEVKDALADAMVRLRLNDRKVDLEAFPPRPGLGESALKIIAGTLDELPDISPCCKSGRAHDPVPLTETMERVAGFETQDQEGAISLLGSLLSDRITLLAFFYTRCTNPLKCSRTISLLGEQDRLLRAKGVSGYRMIGISYEPEFDLPDRLKAYGVNRRLEFSEYCMLLRLTGPIAPFVKDMTLNVGFGASTINAHRLEWLLADGLDVVQSGGRDHWDLQEMTDLIARQAEQKQEMHCK